MYGFLLSGVSTLLPANKVGETLSLGLCALSGVVVYFLLALALGLEEAKLSAAFIKHLGRRG